MKFGTTCTGTVGSKYSRVCSASQFETVVTESDWLIAKRVMLCSEGSLPTSVMSVPCSVVMTLMLPQVRADRVRNGVVYVQQVEVEVSGDLGHLGGQRQRVRRVLEQRVAVGIDLVEADVGQRVAPEARRQAAGDEVHLVAELGECDTQLRGDDAAAPEGGITGDADFKRLSHA